MLDIMRRANRQKWFVGIIVLFVVFAFIVSVFAIWGGAATLDDPTGFGWAARVDGVEIPVVELERQRQQLQNAYQNLLGDQFELDTYGFTLYRQAADQLISQELAFTYATRIGLTAADEEIARTIRTAPIFQRAGRFIGRDQYINELRSRGYDPEMYEAAVRRQITTDKLRDYVSTLTVIPHDEVEKAWRDRGQTAEVDYVIFRSADYEPSEEPGEAVMRRWFEDHRDDYLTPERRRITHAIIERDPVIASIQVTDEECRAFYDENRDRYAISDQRRASHILFKVSREAPEAEAAEVERSARAVLDEIRGGADFEEMARTHSEDTATPPGGDLGWFDRGSMVPEFEQAAFSLPEGQVSDLVRSQFGYHIIRVTGRREAGLRPFEEVRDSIRQQLSFRRAQERLDQLGRELRDRIDLQATSFEATAAEMGYSVGDSGLFARDEPIGTLGIQPRAALEAFRMAVGDVSQPLPVTQGLLVFRLEEIASPQPAAFEDVTDRVRTDWKTSRALERSRAEARGVADAGFEGFKEAADRKKAEILSRDEFTRSTAPTDFSDATLDAIFSAEAGTVVGPVDAVNAVAVVKLLKRGPASPEDRAAARDRLVDDLREEATDRAWRALLQTASRKASIEENPALWEQIAGRYRPAR